jgi:HEAT repeat protein
MRAGLVVFLAGVALGGGALDRHPWSAAVESSNRYYVVETNTFPELGAALAAQLERAYAFFQDRFGPLEGKGRRRMRLALFRTRRGYLEQGDGVKGAIGHFDAALDRCALVWRGETGETGWPVAVHEACHHYLRRRHPQYTPPSWYGEGIACYFEGLLDPTTTRNVSRLRIHAAQAALRAGDARLEPLLMARARVECGKLELLDFNPTRYYGLAWSLVHFLATDPRYRNGFRRFELRLFASRPGADARESHARRLLKEECGDLERLERHWRVWLRGLPLPPPPTAAPVYAWELDSPRAFVRFSALRRLRTDLPPDLRPGVLRAQKDGDLLVRKEACRVLARHMDRDAVVGMILALDLGDEELKEIALKALALRGARMAVPRLLRETDDRIRAVRALAEIGDPRAYPALRDALGDPLLPAGLRARCAAALAEDPDAKVVLDLALRDREPAVRSAAQTALGRRKDASAPAERRRASVSRNVRILNDPTATLAQQCLACRMLGVAKADTAVPLLQRLCAPCYPDRLRLAAVRALVRITGESRGFEPGQGAREREAAYRAWADR